MRFIRFSNIWVWLLFCDQQIYQFEIIEIEGFWLKYNEIERANEMMTGMVTHTHSIFRRGVSFDGRWLGKGDGANFWFVQWKWKATCSFQWIWFIKKIKTSMRWRLSPTSKLLISSCCHTVFFFCLSQTEQIIPNTIRPDCIWNRVKKWMTAAAAVNYFLK